MLAFLIVLASEALTPNSSSISAISESVPAPIWIFNCLAAFLAFAAATSVALALALSSLNSASSSIAVALAAP